MLLTLGFSLRLWGQHFLSGPQMHLRISGEPHFRVKGALVVGMVLRNKSHFSITYILNHTHWHFKPQQRWWWITLLFKPRGNQKGGQHVVTLLFSRPADSRELYPMALISLESQIWESWGIDFFPCNFISFWNYWNPFMRATGTPGPVAC